MPITLLVFAFLRKRLERSGVKLEVFLAKLSVEENEAMVLRRRDEPGLVR